MKKRIFMNQQITDWSDYENLLVNYDKTYSFVYHSEQRNYLRPYLVSVCSIGEGRQTKYYLNVEQKNNDDNTIISSIVYSPQLPKNEFINWLEGYITALEREQQRRSTPIFNI